VLLGATLGYGLSLWALTPPPARGSAVLQNFSLEEVAEKAGHPAWDVIEDKVYSPSPPLGRPGRVARRVVAQATMSDEQAEELARQFGRATMEALARLGGQQTGEVSLNRSTSRPGAGGRPARSELHLPRYYYRVGGTHGVADAWLIAEGGEVTVIVCLTE
jgi:hypothetical protein